MTFEVGSLVRARGREWVVLPESKNDPELLVLRPLGGIDEEVAGIYLPLEQVTSARFPLPDPNSDLGNHLSCGLLRDAVRLSTRSGAGPFRSLGRIAIEPRPYQLVPLLMALRLDPVRMLIADDVGIGKTVEACLIARELLDRAEIERIAVLCPPHLAEQWQRALRQQFHIDAELVLAGTAARLERDCNVGQSLFERHPHVVVSTDYIKSEHRRGQFVEACPELVIVDEAHGCTSDGGRQGQMRHDLLRDLVKDTKRHLVLVTATPHSGKESTFRSLLSLLDPSLVDMPEDLSTDQNRKHRERMARHYVQRRRGDLKDYLRTETPFPERDSSEEHYNLDPEYRAFLDKVLKYCREKVIDRTLGEHRQRVQWWSALALLRSIGSSPAAAADTLRNRASVAETTTADEANDIGRRTVFDMTDETHEGVDAAPGSQVDEEDTPDKKRLLALAREADAFKGAKDAKIKRIAQIIKKLIDDGFSPILFCRFIPTAEYAALELRDRLGKSVHIEAVTGNLPPDEREKRVAELGKNPKRLLVCTDCLSEGINLQEHFDAVVHYDLSWNPTRHEQREGRVDRYGQPKTVVRTVTFYGEDNPVDGIVLEVLLRKHRAIRKQLGISVPVPMDTNSVVEAVFEGLLLRGSENMDQLNFAFAEPQKRAVEAEWDRAADREKKSRSIFAQHAIKVDEVEAEINDSRRAVGGSSVVTNFTLQALKLHKAHVTGDNPFEIDLSESPVAIRDALDETIKLRISFDGKPREDVESVTRTHPLVAALSSYVMDTALDPQLGGVGRRCGVIRTGAVTKRTTVLLLRLRFHVVNQDLNGHEIPLLAEDQTLLGFTGSPDSPEWLDENAVEPLLAATPSANIAPELAREQLQAVFGAFDRFSSKLDEVAKARGDALLDAHRRVRKAAGLRIRSTRVEPHLPADVLGAYIYLPAVSGVRS